MKILNYKVLLILMLPSLSGYAQSGSDYFYYYQGKKIFLEPDKQTIALSWEGDIGSTSLFSSLAKSQTIVSSPVEDHTRNKVIIIDQKASIRKDQKTYYMEVAKDLSENLTEYEREIAGYRSKSGIIMASPCFRSDKGKKIGLSHSLYVQLKDARDVNILYEQAALLNLEVLGHNLYMPLWFTLSCGKDTKINALTAANKLYETSLFKSAEPAFIFHDIEKSSDPNFGDQWGLKNTGQYGSDYAGIDIKAEQAWTTTKGSPTIKVAIFDEGFEMDHPDLKANVFGTGYDTHTRSSPALVRGKHATACAGIVGAVQNNNLGGSGVAPNSKIFSISFDSNNVPTDDLVDGFNWAWQNGADVISNSWGYDLQSDQVDVALSNALTQGRGGKGTVIVFAIGNYNNTNVDYPVANNPLILAVGAISPCGDRKSYTSCDGVTTWGSCYGPRLDIMAPTNATTTDQQGSKGYNTSGSSDYSNLDYTKKFGGTSSSCPAVAGVAALILSANPNLAVKQVIDIIEKSAQKIRTDLYTYVTTAGRPNGTWNSEMGYGLVDAYHAVLMAKSTCLDFIAITSPVSGIDNIEAYGSITASNVINNGALANYHAGNSVTMQPGFKAATGSVFKAYIQDCTGTFGRQATELSNPDVSYNYLYNEEIKNPVANTLSSITSFPNPSTGVINIQISFKENKSASFQIFNILGNKVYESPTKEVTQENYEVNLDGQPSGIYIVHLKTEDSQEQIKFRLNK